MPQNFTAKIVILNAVNIAILSNISPLQNIKIEQIERKKCQKMPKSASLVNVVRFIKPEIVYGIIKKNVIL